MCYLWCTIFKKWVHCTINAPAVVHHSLKGELRRHLSVSPLEINPINVIHAVRNSEKDIPWRFMCISTLDRNPTNVLPVVFISHCVLGWRNTSVSTLCWNPATVIPVVHNSQEIVFLKSLTRFHSGENPCLWLQVHYTVSWWWFVAYITGGSCTCWVVHV